MDLIILIILETEKVWYNKLCTLSTKNLKPSNFFQYQRRWCLIVNFFHTYSSSDYNRIRKNIILHCLFSHNDY